MLSTTILLLSPISAAPNLAPRFGAAPDLVKGASTTVPGTTSATKNKNQNLQGCYEDHKCFFECPVGFVKVEKYTAATSTPCSDFCCPTQVPPPPPPLPPCPSAMTTKQACAYIDSDPQCWAAYAASKVTANSGLSASYYQEILECWCRDQPPELCIGHALVAEGPAMTKGWHGRQVTAVFVSCLLLAFAVIAFRSRHHLKSEQPMLV